MIDSGAPELTPGLSRAQYNVPLFINDRLDIALLLSCHLHVGQSDLPYQLARHLLGPDRLLGVSVNTPEEMLDILKPEHAGMVDYVGIGPAFGTKTKKNLNPVIGVRGVRDVLQVLGDSEIKAVVIGEQSDIRSVFTAPEWLKALTTNRPRSPCSALPFFLSGGHPGGITPETIPNVLAQTPAPVLSSADSTAASPTKYRSLDGLAVVSSIAASPTPDVAARELRALFAQRDEYTTRLERGGEWSAEKVVQVAAELVELLRSEEKKPLVHHITVRLFPIRNSLSFSLAIWDVSVACHKVTDAVRGRAAHRTRSSRTTARTSLSP